MRQCRWATILVMMTASSALAVENDFNIWINEFHYDNSGTDSGEFVEIVAPTSFSAPGSIHLTLYNGATGLTYDVFNLANASFTTSTSGDFTLYRLDLPANGIQNGAPDGLALTSTANGVLQFLSYEGSFAAADGLANTAVSTDIGVSETGSTPVGDSLQLGGAGGNSYADFAWSGPAANTAGAVNTSQTFASVTASETPSAAPATDLILTGIIDGPLTGGQPKAIELFVVNDIPDLSAYGLESANNGAAPAGAELTLSGSASAGDFLYIADDAADFSSFFGFAPGFDDSVASINGDDAILLYLGDQIIDAFGDVGTDGSGEAWEYTDGWAYRVSETGPDGETFVLDNWQFSGTDALDGETSNDTAVNPFPIGTFQPAQQIVPEPASIVLWSLLGIAACCGAFYSSRWRRPF